LSGKQVRTKRGDLLAKGILKVKKRKEQENKKGRERGGAQGLMGGGPKALGGVWNKGLKK